MRLYQDYRPLNQVTVADPYSMQRIDDTLDLLGEAGFLTKLDLCKGYYQILVDEADVPKTAFSTPFGKFEYIRMPFGLRNAPTHFQRCMDDVLCDLYECSSAYIDDVIIFSRSFDEHIRHIDEVLFALCEYGFTIKPSKCIWEARSAEYLGFEVGEGLLSVPEARRQSIQAISQPKTVKQLRSFLGTLGYYRRFVPQFSTHSAVLTPATKKGMPSHINWSSLMGSSFHSLKSSLSRVLCLTIPNSLDMFTLVTDASGRGIGSVFCVTRDCFDYPVAFHSRQLNERETKYSASELEGLAVVKAIKHFEIHLFGQKFKVVTDHIALTRLFCSTVLNAKLWRWALFLQQFDITFEYLPGKFNVVADRMSHQEWPPADVENTPPSVQVQDIVTFRPSVQDALQDGQPVPEAVLENGTKKTPEGVPPTFAGEMWEESHLIQLLPHEHTLNTPSQTL